MRSRSIVVAILLVAGSLVHGANLITRDGTIYRDYEVKAVELDGLRITHADGIGVIPFEHLPEEILKKYHLTAESVAAHDKTVGAPDAVAEPARQA